MKKENLYIGEIFVSKRDNDNQLIEKRIGYKALQYIPQYGSYISLSRHEEFYLGCLNNSLNDMYIKEGTLIPYLSFGNASDTNEEICEKLKEKIQSLVLGKKKTNNLVNDDENMKENYSKEKRNDMIWKQKFELAKIYYEHYGNLNIPYNFITKDGINHDEYGIYLGAWISQQKVLYRSSKLSEERLKLLLTIGINREDDDVLAERKFAKVKDYQEKHWQGNYEIVKTYYEIHQNLNAPSDFKTKNGVDYSEDGLCIYTWIASQKAQHKKKKMPENRINLLKELGINLEYVTKEQNYDAKWNQKYELACIFKEHYPDKNISETFKTQNGYEYSKDGICLGQWIVNQKSLYQKDKLSEERIKLLESIGINLKKNSKGSEDYMDTSKIYIGEVYTRVKRNDKTFIKRIGYKAFYYVKAWNSFISLSKREEYYVEKMHEKSEGSFIKDGTLIPYESFGKKSSDKNIIFDEIKIKIEELVKKRNDDTSREKTKEYNVTRNSTWEEKYNLARIYYETYGTLSMPASFKTKNGFDYDADGFNLNKWLIVQKRAYKGQGGKELTDEQKQKLREIGLKITTRNTRSEIWNEKYEIAKKYYLHHGNLEIPYGFKTVDGIEYDENGINLFSWVSAQRHAKRVESNALTDERIELLDDIGMVWTLSDNWMAIYKLAKIYYELHENLNVPQNFKTSNGNKYDEHGENLWLWLIAQRCAFRGEDGYEISDRQIKLLDDIYMIWYDERYNEKFQSEEINEDNTLKKRKELSNRFKSFLNNYGEAIPSSKTLNKNFTMELEKVRNLK